MGLGAGRARGPRRGHARLPGWHVETPIAHLGQLGTGQAFSVPVCACRG